MDKSQGFTDWGGECEGITPPKSIKLQKVDLEAGTLTCIGMFDQMPTCNSFIVLVMESYSKPSFLSY